MKKIKKILTSILVLALLTGNGFAFSNNQIELNGDVKTLSNDLIDNDTNVFISVRDLADMLGYVVDWNAQLRAVSLKSADHELLLWVDNAVVRKDNHSEVKLTSETFIQDGTLYMPLNGAVDVFGLSLEKVEDYYRLSSGSGSVTGSGYTVEELYALALKNSEVLRTAEENISRYEITEEDAQDNLGNTEPSSTGGSAAEAARLAAYQNYYGQGIALKMAEKTLNTTKESIYNDLLTALETIAIESENLKLVTQSVDIYKTTYEQSKLKYDLGLLSYLELDGARINYENYKKTMEMQKLTLENAWIDLNDMIGMKSDARISWDYNMSVYDIEVSDLETHITNVLAYSPTIWNLEQQIKLAENSVRFYVFNTGGTAYEAEEIDVTLAKINLKNAKDTLDGTLRTTYNSIITLKENDAALKLKIDEAANNMTIAKKNLEVGLATELQVETAELAYKQALNNKLKNIATYLETVRLYEKPWIAQ